MAAVREHDVFISYAHADNGIALGSSVPFGWVTTLAANLNIGVNVLPKDIFIDHQLKPGDVFSADLVEKVEASTLLVLLLSQNYIDSEWCGKELEHFIRAHSGNPDSRPPDVFVVELCPYEELTGVPAAIQNLRKHRIHAKFWHRPHDAPAPIVAGYPSPSESGQEGERHYWRQRDALCTAIDARLRARKAADTGNRPPQAAVAPAPPATPSPSRPALGTVLLADVTDDLCAKRTALQAALEHEGVVALPAGDYVGLTPAEFEAAFSQDLARSDLFIQLLSATPGRTGRGFAAPLPQLQYARATVGRAPVMQWCEQQPAPADVPDAGHRALFETRFLRATTLAEYTSEVMARLRAESERKASVAAAASAAAVGRHAPRKVVFVDDLASAPALTQRLCSLIRSEDCQVRTLPPGVPLGNNGVDVKEVLRPCRAGLTIFADRAKHVTVYNRLVYFLNQAAEAGLPLLRWGVYMDGGDVASEFGIPSDDVVAVSEQGLAEFLRGVQG